MPVNNWYSDPSPACPNALNMPIGDSIPTQFSKLTFTNGVDSVDGLIVEYSEQFNDILIGFLGEANAADDEICTDNT